MNKKGIILLSTMMILAGGAVFASGQQDTTDDDTYGRGRGYRAEQDLRGGRYAPAYDEDFCPVWDEDFEETTMTGTVDFTSRGTTLNVDGEEWQLMYPLHAVGLDIEDGTEVTVTGWALPELEEGEYPGRGMQSFDGDNLFHVTSAEIDGEVYELDFAPGRMGGRSGGFSPMGGGRRR